ncbi:hypothetical protein [Deinococcus aerophilus]|nr:hypothetical protein [Deinococcus aerophilus]
MPRALAWIAAVTLPLAACGTPTPSPTPTLFQALEDCPSCGLMPSQPASEPLFWGWNPQGVGGVEVWTYGEERQNGDVAEVYIKTAGRPTPKTSSYPLGCLLEPQESGDFSRPLPHSGTLRVTEPVSYRALTSQAGADAICADMFGMQWHAVAHASMYEREFAQGVWVAGHRPADTGPEW